MPNQTAPESRTLAGFFSVPAKAARKVRPLVAIWPCGTRWQIETAARGEWSAPVYRDGAQTGVDVLADTRAELIAELESEGARVERETPAPALTLTAESADRATVNWSEGAARFHVWAVRRADGWQVESVAFKNPALASDGKPMRTDAPGYFNTRQIDLDAKAHAALLAAVRALATPAALDAATAAYVTEQEARQRTESRAARVAYLAKCVAAIQAAGADDLGAAVLESSVETARAAELLRMAGEKTERLAAPPVSARLAEIRNAARVIHFASPEELTAAAPPPHAERTDESGRRYIDMTPSWAGVLPVYMTALTDGNATGQAAARTELHRMAKAADSAVLVASIAKGA